MSEPSSRATSAVVAELALALLSITAAFLLFSLITASGVVSALMPAAEDSPVLAFLLTPVTWLIAALIYRAIGRRMDGENPPPLRDPRMTSTFPIAVIGLHILLAVLGSAVLAQFLELIGMPVSEQSSVLAIVENGGTELTLLIVTAIVLAPITEELLFRGQLFRRLVPAGGRPAAYALSGLAFALIHLNPAGFLVYVWLGYVFARAYYQTGRLWAAMLVHAGNNATTLAILLWFPEVGA